MTSRKTQNNCYLVIRVTHRTVTSKITYQQRFSPPNDKFVPVEQREILQQNKHFVLREQSPKQQYLNFDFTEILSGKKMCAPI